MKIILSNRKPSESNHIWVSDISSIDLFVDDSEFDDVELSEFEVIVVANLYRVTEGRAEALENWVRDGGGLVFLLGDQADEDVYNDVLYKDGAGLLPVRLSGIEGDEKESLHSYITRENWSENEIFISNILSIPLDRNGVYKPVPDYLIYHPTVLIESPENLKILENPNHPKVKSYLELLYKSKLGTLVYKINHGPN